VIHPPAARQRGFTAWFTGLSGAGKSTIATQLAAQLRSRGLLVEILDGDEVRLNLSKGLGFTREDRDTNIRRIGFVAELLTRNGVIVLVAAISPYRAVRDEVRSRIGSFIEVFVDCSLEELLRRDAKGLYTRALRGEISNFTGISDPYEAPLSPELRLDTLRMTSAECTAAVLNVLGEKGYLPADAVAPAPTRIPPNGHSVAGGIAPHGGVLRICLAGQDRRKELKQEAVRLAAIEIDTWAMTDLELLAGGGLSPLTGFLGESDLLSVRDRMRLADGTPWSLPIILPVERDVAIATRPGQRVALRASGEPLAILTVTEAYRYDRRHLAREVFGTEDDAHPGASRMLAQPAHALAGPVEVMQLPPSPFQEFRLAPAQTRALFAERGWRTVVGFQTRNPIHRAHEYLLKVALEQVDGLLLHPLVGETKDDDIPAVTRMQCYQTLLDHHFPKERVAFAVFPAAMRYAGPREAVFHALVRKNYGCTHFIVGRDHAGVGSYYGTYAAQEIFEAYAPGEIAIQLLKFEHAFFCRSCLGMATTRTCPHGGDQRVALSGTRVREILRAGDPLPIEFTRPEIAQVLGNAELAWVS